MTLLEFLNARRKAIAAYVTGAAGALTVALEADKTSLRDIILALLVPLVAAAAVHQVGNK